MLTANLSQPSFMMIRAFLLSALTVAGAQCSQREVGNEIARLGFYQARTLLYSAWEASMPEPKAKSEETPGPKPSWTKAWSIASDLGLSEHDWLDMTPRMFAAVQQQRVERMQREEWLVGVLASTFANFSMTPPKRPLRPEMFMIHRIEEEEIPPELFGEHIMREIAKLKG